MPDPVLDFWFDFASTYSYPAAMRDRRARARRWRAGALPAVSARPDLQGARLGQLAVQSLSGQGPQHVARPRAHLRAISDYRSGGPSRFRSTACWRRVSRSSRLSEPWGEDFCARRLSSAIRRGSADRRSGRDRRRLAGLGIEAAPVLEPLNPTPIKSRLRTQTEEAGRLGIFGAPSFVTADGELFWGNDRLEQALAWAKR